MNRCIFDGCQNEGANNFGVRLRLPDGSAIWAPNTAAYVCDFHAERGMRVTVTLELIGGNEIETNVRSLGRAVMRRTSHDALEG